MERREERKKLDQEKRFTKRHLRRERATRTWKRHRSREKEDKETHWSRDRETRRETIAGKGKQREKL